MDDGYAALAISNFSVSSSFPGSGPFHGLVRPTSAFGMFIFQMTILRAFCYRLPRGASTFSTWVRHTVQFLWGLAL